jgi:hypothetical protein
MLCSGEKITRYLRVGYKTIKTYYKRIKVTKVMNNDTTPLGGW